MKWVTREKARVDRIACPWLITRFIDKEVNAVARILVQHGIDVTALHNHGLMDTPRLFYMHFWANDDPVKLAQGLKAALGQTNSANP